MDISCKDAESRLICRLCSNKASLISLFKGKSRTVRDFIRKIVAVTIGVKYEEDSYFDCICFSCVIETYNILVFQTKSLKNQERLQALVPNRVKKSDSGTKLSDIELPNYTELKPILTKWLFTKSFLSTTDSGESTDKSSNEESPPACVKSNADKTIQTHSPKCFNVSIQTAFKPIIPTVTIETQTNLIETINVDTQCNLTKNESSKKPRIKNKYTQCELVKLKVETTKPKGLFDVYTQTIDLKTENNNEAIITRKCDSDKYNCVHKTLNNRIKNINSDRNKTKQLKDKLKQHKLSRNIDELFEPLKTDKAAVGLEFTIKQNSSDSTNDSTELNNDGNSLILVESSDEKITDSLQVEQVNESGDKLVTETLIKSSKEDESKNIRTRKQLSLKPELKIPSPLNTADIKKSERIAKISQSNQRATGGLLKVIKPVTSPKVKEIDIPIETFSQLNKNRSESECVRSNRKVCFEPDTSPRIKETLPSTTKSPLNTTDIKKSERLSTKSRLSQSDEGPNKNRSDGGKVENECLHSKRKVCLKPETPLQIKETLPNITKSSLNTDSQKSERSTSGLLKVIEPATSSKVKETDIPIQSSQSNKNRSEDRKFESGRVRYTKQLNSRPESNRKNYRLQIKEIVPLNTDSQKSERLSNKSDNRATSGLLKVIEPVTSTKVKETNIPIESSSHWENKNVESGNVRQRRKSNSKPESKISSPKNNRSQIKESSSNFTDTTDERLSDKPQLSQSNERATIGLLKVIEPITSPKVKENNSPIETSSPDKNVSLPGPSVYNLLTVDCQRSGLLEVKVEQDSPSLINLDTSIVLKSSPASYDNEPSPINDSPNSSSGLLQKTGKVEYLRTCPECGRIIHTKNEMVEHRKSHMKCYLCKKRFTSIKKTKEHMNSDCIRKLDATNPIICITKIEHCQSLTDQYPTILGQITQSPKRRRKNDHSEEMCSRKNIDFIPSTSSSE